MRNIREMASCHSRPGNVVFHKSIVEKIKFVNSQFHKKGINHLTNHKLFSTQFWNQDLTICLLQNQASVGYKQNFKIHNQILNHATPKNQFCNVCISVVKSLLVCKVGLSSEYKRR